MKSYFLLLRLNLRNLLAGFRGAMRKPNGKIDISRLILYPLALLGVLSADGARAAGGQLYPADDFAPAGKHSGALHVADPA